MPSSEPECGRAARSCCFCSSQPGAELLAAEHVRMAADHLVRDRAGNIGEAEEPRLLRHARVIHDLEQQVAQLVGQLRQSRRAMASATSYASSIV